MAGPPTPECGCGTLERLAKEPAIPVAFDPTRREYHILGGDGSQVVIYYCPFCGGRAPASRVHEFFAHISTAEIMRLQAIFAKLATLSDVLSAFGPPDRDNAAGTTIREPGKGGPDRIEVYRTLTYTSLSTTADVSVQVHASGRVQLSLIPKAIDATSA